MPLSQLAPASVVLPSGQVVRRDVTFGPRAQEVYPEDIEGENESDPLLGKHHEKEGRIQSFGRRAWGSTKQKVREGWAFTQSKTGKGVLKCSIAYVLGSMATFVPPIYQALGHQEGKHVVATITVYYHPARSIGSTFEAIVCATIAWLYTAVLSFSSMSISIFFGQQLDLIAVGHAIVLIVFCGGGLGFVGWVKQRMSHPVINISCSLAALALITILTKEGSVQASTFSDDKVVQELIMVLMGVAFSTAVALFIYPVSARKELRSSIASATDAFGDMLSMTTRAFLKGTEDDMQHHAFDSASEKYRKVYTSMAKYLKESRHEHYFLGTEKEFDLEAKLVACLQRLAQNAGGLRSAATTQFLLLAQPTLGAYQTYYASNKTLRSRVSSYHSFDGAISSGNRTPTMPMEPIEEDTDVLSVETRDGLEISAGWPSFSNEDDKKLPPINSPSDIFTRFIMHLGPSMVTICSFACQFNILTCN